MQDKRVGATAVNSDVTTTENEKVSKSFGRKLRDNVEGLQGELENLKKQHNKFQGEVRMQIQDLVTKTQSTFDVMQRIFSFLGDIETRIEAFRTLGIKANSFTDEEYETTWDDIKGLRVRGPTEFIQQDDFVKITYYANDKETGKKVMEGVDFPLRLGTNTLLIENQIVGKRVDAGVLKFDVEYPKDFKSEPRLAGKTLSFEVTIGKVKCKKEVKK